MAVAHGGTLRRGTARAAGHTSNGRVVTMVVAAAAFVATIVAA